MFNGIFHIRKPENEPVLNYAPGSRERSELDTPSVDGSRSLRRDRLREPVGELLKTVV